MTYKHLHSVCLIDIRKKNCEPLPYATNLTVRKLIATMCVSRDLQKLLSLKRYGFVKNRKVRYPLL